MLVDGRRALFLASAVHTIFVLCTVSKGKGNAHRRTGHEAPEGKQMYSPTLPLTSVLNGGG